MTTVAGTVPATPTARTRDERNTTMPRPTRWYVTATVACWDAAACDYCEIDLDHYSPEETAEAAEDDAREAWSDHGYNPETVRVRPFEWVAD